MGGVKFRLNFQLSYLENILIATLCYLYYNVLLILTLPFAVSTYTEDHFL